MTEFDCLVSWDIYNLATWLEQKGTFTTARDVINFLEKPYHWENEFKEMVIEQEAEKKKESEIAN